MAEESGKLQTSRDRTRDLRYRPQNSLLLAEQVLAYVSNDFAAAQDFSSMSFVLSTRSGAELFEPHQLSVSQNHPYPVV